MLCMCWQAYAAGVAMAGHPTGLQLLLANSVGQLLGKLGRCPCAAHAQEDMRKIYETLMRDVNIRVIELQDHVLSTYDRQISTYTQKEFAR